MKKLLITGGSHAELPLIKAAMKLGYYVITTGNNRDGLGHRAADKYICGDFSDKEFVLSVAREEGVDGIVSGCNDFAYFSTAYACEKLGFAGHDSYETTSVIHHKNSFRELTRSLGIRTPKAVTLHSEEDVKAACEHIGFPIVIKAVDLTGGKGVLVCHSEDEALAAYKNSVSVSRENVAAAEEYIQGSNHGISVILKDRRVAVYFCDNELYYKNKYLVSGACGPADVPLCAVSRLCRDIEKIAERLSLADGLFHCQFILEKGNVPVMIDPCRRSPGDLYLLLESYATGVDYPETIIKAETGQPFEVKMPTSFRNISRVCVMTDRNGIYRGIDTDPVIEEKLIDKLVWAKDGERIEDFMKYKAGIYFFETKTPSEMFDLFDRFHELVRIKTE